MELNNYEKPQIEILIVDDADVLTLSVGDSGYAGETGNAGGYWANKVASTAQPAQQTAPTNQQN